MKDSKKEELGLSDHIVIEEQKKDEEEANYLRKRTVQIPLKSVGI